MAIQDSTQPRSVKASDFVDPRLAQAGAITSVLIRLFGGEYPDDERPKDSAMFTSLTHVGKLLHECVEHLDELGTDEPVSWLEGVQSAAGLVDLMNACIRSDEGEITYSDDLMANYLWSIGQAIEGSLPEVVQTSAKGVTHG
jgi:hypothetical protein